MVIYNKKNNSHDNLVLPEDMHNEGSVSSTELVASAHKNGDDQSHTSHGSNSLTRGRFLTRKASNFGRFFKKKSSSFDDEQDSTLAPPTTISLANEESTSSSKKQVSFAQEQEQLFEYDTSSSSSDEDNDDQDVQPMYYTSREMKQVRSQAQQLVRSLVNSDSGLPQHISIAYGLDNDSSSSCSEEETISPERAMANYYKFMQREVTSCRGLERRLCSGLEDDAKDAVQAVLAKQNELRAQRNSGNTLALAQESSRASAQAKRFARLLGKGDAAMAKKQ